MFLKSLSMKGFKSFADPTVLEFEPGITVVVGPNGSGKSNVVDAVTWVLGAQGPRSLRSAKMEDVIFAGTSSRPQLGRAEVSLTIDNASGKLPIDLSEVTITRTLFRSGDSEYAINGAPCRLLDIQELLSDSGVGRQQHMIIGQGQLDTVLNARPEDRRAIIEEAAGVLKHRRRRERAERRLAATAENLERLGDLVREVRRQIRPLERQAAAARSARCRCRRAARGAPLSGRGGAGRPGGPQTCGCDRPDRVPRRGAASCTRPSSGSTPRPRARPPSCRLAGRRTWPTPSAGCRGWSSEPAVSRASCVSADGASWRRWTPPPMSTSCPRSRQKPLAWPPSWPSPRPRRRREVRPNARSWPSPRPRWRTRRRALRERWAGVLGGEAPDQAIARVRARTELVARAAVREQQDLDALSARVSSLEERAAAAAVRADLLANTLGRARASHGRPATPPSASAPPSSRQRYARPKWPRPPPTRRKRRATAARPAPRRWSVRCRTSKGAGGRELLRDVDGVVGSLVDLVEIDEGWDAAFEAAAGAGVAAVVVDGRRAAQAALSTLRERGVTGAVLAPRQSAARDRRRCRRGAAPSRSAATSGRARAAPSRSPCSTRSSGGPCAWTAWRRRSTSRSPATT